LVRNVLFKKIPSINKCPSAERPVAERDTGLSEAILRVSSRATEESIRSSLSAAAKRLFEIYPNSDFFCSLTANVCLEHVRFKTYSIFFGQRFSAESKELLYGMEHDADDNITKKAASYSISTVGDTVHLPVIFSTEYFGSLFKRNFGSSEVRVSQVVSLIYKFTRGMKNYEEEATSGQRWVRLF
jgi:hypothetical protein